MEFMYQLWSAEKCKNAFLKLFGDTCYLYPQNIIDLSWFKNKPMNNKVQVSLSNHSWQFLSFKLTLEGSTAHRRDFCHTDDRSGLMTPLMTRMSSPYMETEVKLFPSLSLITRRLLWTTRKQNWVCKGIPWNFHSTGIFQEIALSILKHIIIRTTP